MVRIVVIRKHIIPISIRFFGHHVIIYLCFFFNHQIRQKVCLENAVFHAKGTGLTYHLTLPHDSDSFAPLVMSCAMELVKRDFYLTPL